MFVLLGGTLGWIVQHFGNDWVLVVLLGMTLAGSVLSLRLKPA
ncbi:hypothetical protein [Congregibacter sp.]